MQSEESNEMLKHALAYHARGWNVIPVGPNKKPPYKFEWAQYVIERIPVELIHLWWGVQYPGYGIALITGKVSKIIVLDFDTKHNRTPDELKIPHTALSRTQRDGYHAFFKHPGFYVKGTKGVVWGLGIDIQGEGNLAVLAPTQGEHGIYRWENSPETTEIAELPEELAEAIQKNNTKTSQSPLEGILGTVHDGNRNNAACRFIGTLLSRSSEADWGDAWTLVETWNKRFAPPLEIKVLRTIFESVVEKETAKRKKDDLNPPPTLTVTKKTETKVLSPAMHIKDLCELDLPPTDWDIEHLIEHGTPNMLSAAPNSYKSWLAVYFSICIARGMPIFGHFATKKQGVMIVNEEDHLGQLKNRVGMLLTNIDEELEIYLHVQKEIKLTADYVDQLIAEAKALNATFMILDSLRALHDANENDSQEMQVIMDLIKKFTHEGITILFTHHHRKESKGPGYKKSETGEESRGSSSINAAIHGHLTCEPRIVDGQDVIVITQPKLKCAAKLKPFAVKIISTIDGNISGFEYEGDFDDDSKEIMKANILGLLKKSSTWLSKRDFVQTLSVSEKTIQNRLRELEIEQKIIGESRKVLESKKEPLSYQDGSHQEKFYQIPKYKTPIDDDDF